MNPNISEAPLEPAFSRTNKAILLCKSHFCIAVAIRKPPKKRYIVLLAYGSAASCILTIPSKGNIAKGTNAVTATGTASVAHHVPISKNIAAVL